MINSKEADKYSDIFLGEILENLVLDKSQHLSKSNSNNFKNQMVSIFGRSLEQSEIDEFARLNDNDFKKKIYTKFQDKKNNMVNIIGDEQFQKLEKRIFLQLIDQNWKTHIQYLEQLRQVIGLRSYGQRDPLVEYKKEAFNLFENLLGKLKIDLITILFNLQIINNEQNQLDENKKKFKDIATKKIGRNDPCTCNSGKKYKHCCGRL